MHYAWLLNENSWSVHEYYSWTYFGKTCKTSWIYSWNCSWTRYCIHAQMHSHSWEGHMHFREYSCICSCTFTSGLMHNISWIFMLTFMHIHDWANAHFMNIHAYIHEHSQVGLCIPWIFMHIYMNLDPDLTIKVSKAEKMYLIHPKQTFFTMQIGSSFFNLLASFVLA